MHTCDSHSLKTSGFSCIDVFEVCATIHIDVSIYLSHDWPHTTDHKESIQTLDIHNNYNNTENTFWCGVFDTYPTISMALSVKLFAVQHITVTSFCILRLHLKHIQCICSPYFRMDLVIQILLNTLQCTRAWVYVTILNAS